MRTCVARDPAPSGSTPAVRPSGREVQAAHERPSRILDQHRAQRPLPSGRITAIRLPASPRRAVLHVARSRCPSGAQSGRRSRCEPLEVVTIGVRTPHAHRSRSRSRPSASGKPATNAIDRPSGDQLPRAHPARSPGRAAETGAGPLSTIRPRPAAVVAHRPESPSPSSLREQDPRPVRRPHRLSGRCLAGCAAAPLPVRPDRRARADTTSHDTRDPRGALVRRRPVSASTAPRTAVAIIPARGTGRCRRRSGSRGACRRTRR